MRSEDTGLLNTVTTALDNLRAQGSPLNIDVRMVVVTINGSQPVKWAYDDTAADWNITAE